MLLPHKVFFKKQKSGFGPPVSFSGWFSKINIPLVAFTSWDIWQNVYRKYLLTRLWRHKFWNSPYRSNQSVFSTWPKTEHKNLNILRTKRAFKMKYSIFIFFKGFHWSNLNNLFWKMRAPILIFGNLLTKYKPFTIFRCSHRRCSVKKGVLKIFTILTGKHLYWSVNITKCLRRTSANSCFYIFWRLIFIKVIFDNLVLKFLKLKKGMNVFCYNAWNLQ